MITILDWLWRRVVETINPPRYQLPFFTFTQIQLARAYYVAAELKIAELVSERPRTVEQLAEAAGCDAESLRPILRLLASFRVFAEDAAGKFHMTGRARVLLADAPGSIRPWVLFQGQSELWQGYAHMLEAVKTGTPAIKLATGKTFYECVGARPGLADAFYGVLANWGDQKCRTILQAYDFGRFRSVVDVGGGQGRLVSHLLAAYPQLQGTVFDLDETIRQARERLAGVPFADRLHFVSGSFFEQLPEGADLYVINDVLGDWQKDEAAAILDSCRRAMKPDSVLLIADAIIDPRNGKDRVSKLLAVERASFFGTSQRTRAQFDALFARVGLVPAAVHPTSIADLQLLELHVGERVPPQAPRAFFADTAHIAGDTQRARNPAGGRQTTRNPG